MKIIKTFFKGFLYLILSPFIIVAFALYAVYALFLYFVELLIATYKFFTGSKLTTETKEDKKVKQIVIEKNKAAATPAKEEKTEEIITPAPAPTTNTTINNFYITKDQLPHNSLPTSEVKAIETSEAQSNVNEGGKENE